MLSLETSVEGCMRFWKHPKMSNGSFHVVSHVVSAASHVCGRKVPFGPLAVANYGIISPHIFRRISKLNVSEAQTPFLAEETEGFPWPYLAPAASRRYPRVQETNRGYTPHHVWADHAHLLGDEIRGLR